MRSALALFRLASMLLVLAQDALRFLVLAKIPCAPKIVRFPVATAVPFRLSLHPRAPRICPEEPPAVYLYILRMEEPGRFHDATLVRLRQPDRTGGAALPVEKTPISLQPSYTAAPLHQAGLIAAYSE